MLNPLSSAWRRGMNLLPIDGFHFDRPVVLIQSDDWGRVGVRDREGWEQLRAAGISLGERAYDFYTLETAEDLAELRGVLKRHRDSSGRNPSVQMNFIVANLDFAKVLADASGQLSFLPLAERLPGEWDRPGLLEAYRAGISEGVFSPALHGLTHFCRAAVQGNHLAGGERGALLQKLWTAGTPYIHWRMPWIGYEYWDPEEKENDSFLDAEAQRELVGAAVGIFAKLFSRLPHSACAPGYRANSDTHRAWAQHGIRVAQNGPGTPMPPHFGEHEMLQLSRSVEFEPASDAAFSVEHCVARAESCFQQGIPAIVSVHSINFHSTVKDFRSRTLKALDEFLSVLEAKHHNLLYLHDRDLYEVITRGGWESDGSAQVNVMRKKFSKAAWARQNA